MRKIKIIQFIFLKKIKIASKSLFICFDEKYFIEKSYLSIKYLYNVQM